MASQCLRRLPGSRPSCPLNGTCHMGSLWGGLSWWEQLQGSGEPARGYTFPSLRRAHPLVAGVRNSGGGAEGRRRAGHQWGAQTLAWGRRAAAVGRVWRV